MKNVWNWILVIEGIIIILLIGVVIHDRPPCTLDFKVIPGTNFNQPYPVYEHCSGSEPAKIIIWR
jgi:hypothetical protein